MTPLEVSPELFTNVIVLGIVLGVVGIIAIRIIKRIRRAKQQIAPPSSKEPEVPTELRVGRKVKYELTRLRQLEGESDSKRIVTRIGKFRKNQVFVTLRTNVSKGMRYGTYFVDLQKLFKDGVLRWDVFYSEPIDPQDEKPVWSDELEKYLANSKRGQRIQVASMISKIEITRQMVILMIAFGIVAGMLVLNLNSIYHFTPTTFVRWFNQLPTGFQP